MSKKSSWKEFREFIHFFSILTILLLFWFSCMFMLQQHKINEEKQTLLNKQIKQQQEIILLEHKIFQFFDDKGDLKYISTPSQEFLAKINKQYFKNIDLAKFHYSNEALNTFPILKDFYTLNKENNESCKNLVLVNEKSNLKIIGYDVYEGDYYKVLKVVVNNSFYFFVIISQKSFYYSYSFDTDFDIQYRFFENNLGETISKIYNFKQYKCEKNVENKKYVFLKEEEKKLLSTLKN